MIIRQKHSIKKPNSSYYLTLTIVGWVDVFTRESYRKIIIETLQYYCKNKGLNIYAYCIMSNHVHIISNVDDAFSLSDIIRDFKKYTSRQIIMSIQNDPESRRE